MYYSAPGKVFAISGGCTRTHLPSPQGARAAAAFFIHLTQRDVWGYFSGVNGEWVEVDWTALSWVQSPLLSEMLKHTEWPCCTAGDRQHHRSLWPVVFHMGAIGRPWTPRRLQIPSTPRLSRQSCCKVFLVRGNGPPGIGCCGTADEMLSHLHKHLGGFWFTGFVFGRLTLWETANIDKVKMGRKKSDGAKWGRGGEQRRHFSKDRAGVGLGMAFCCCCLFGKNKVILASVNLQWQKTSKGFWVSIFLHLWLNISLKKGGCDKSYPADHGCWHTGKFNVCIWVATGLILHALWALPFPWSLSPVG